MSDIVDRLSIFHEHIVPSLFYGALYYGLNWDQAAKLVAEGIPHDTIRIGQGAESVYVEAVPSARTVSQYMDVLSARTNGSQQALLRDPQAAAASTGILFSAGPPAPCCMNCGRTGPGWGDSSENKSEVFYYDTHHCGSGTSYSTTCRGCGAVHRPSTWSRPSEAELQLAYPEEVARRARWFFSTRNTAFSFELLQDFDRMILHQNATFSNLAATQNSRYKSRSRFRSAAEEARAVGTQKSERYLLEPDRLEEGWLRYRSHRLLQRNFSELLLTVVVSGKVDELLALLNPTLRELLNGRFRIEFLKVLIVIGDGNAKTRYRICCSGKKYTGGAGMCLAAPGRKTDGRCPSCFAAAVQAGDVVLPPPAAPAQGPPAAAEARPPPGAHEEAAGARGGVAAAVPPPQPLPAAPQAERVLRPRRAAAPDPVQPAPAQQQPAPPAARPAPDEIVFEILRPRINIRIDDGPGRAPRLREPKVKEFGPQLEAASVREIYEVARDEDGRPIARVAFRDSPVSTWVPLQEIPYDVQRAFERRQAATPDENPEAEGVPADHEAAAASRVVCCGCGEDMFEEPPAICSRCDSAFCAECLEPTDENHSALWTCGCGEGEDAHNMDVDADVDVNRDGGALPQPPADPQAPRPPAAPVLHPRARPEVDPNPPGQAPAAEGPAAQQLQRGAAAAAGPRVMRSVCAPKTADKAVHYNAGVVQFRTPNGFGSAVFPLQKPEGSKEVGRDLGELLGPVFEADPGLFEREPIFAFDNACNFYKHARLFSKSDNASDNPVLKAVGENEIKSIVDPFHFRGHIGAFCKQHCSPHRIPRLQGVNLEVCEQAFRKLNRHKFSTMSMGPVRYEFFLNSIMLLEQDEFLEEQAYREEVERIRAELQEAQV